MKNKLFNIILLGFSLISCHINKHDTTSNDNKIGQWNYEKLMNKSIDHQDTTKWDWQLFNQDLETYNKYTEIFNSYPLNKSPFPVAKYDYAVSSIPFTFDYRQSVFKGVKIGEYKNPDSDIIITKMTLIVLTNEGEESTLVDSRNYPYLTAQGKFNLINNELDWVFSASPDGFSNLLVNMKLFDLRFGETIVIFLKLINHFSIYK
ncbi:MAG: hypothetical protein R2771_09690 [Saprospiraceae bacterium]